MLAAGLVAGCLRTGGHVGSEGGTDTTVDGETADGDGADDGGDIACTPDAATTVYPDDDGDGFGDESSPSQTCGPPGNEQVAKGGDYNDDDETIKPSAVEQCNDVDDNCDGVVDGWRSGCPNATMLGTPAPDRFAALAVQSPDEVYVVGETQGSLGGQNNAGSADAVLAKYGQDRQLTWLRLFGSPKLDAARDVALGSDGGVYVAGTAGGGFGGETNPAAPDDAPFIAKYDADGQRKWLSILPVTERSSASAVAAAPEGGVYVLGTASGELDGRTIDKNDTFLGRYDAGGSKKWFRRVDGAGTNDSERARTLEVVGDAVYVTGSTNDNVGSTSEGGDDVFVVAYSLDGSRNWARQFGSGAYDVPTDLARKPGGGVFVLGTTFGALGPRSSSGDPATFWTHYDPAGNRGAYHLVTEGDGVTGNSMVVIDGQLYIGGSAQGFTGTDADGMSDAFVATFDTQDSLGWVQMLGSSSTEWLVIAPGPQGNIFAAGSTKGNLAGGSNAGKSDAFVAW